MKVLSLVPYKIFPAKVGGQKGIALFNEYFSRTTALVCVTVKSNDPSYAKGYRVLNTIPDATSRYINPALFFRLKKIIRQQAVTHLILEHPYYGWLGIMLQKLAGVKLIIHSHNIESIRWRSLGKWWWKILWWYERTAHRSADYSFFIHDADRAFAIKEFSLDAARCTTITYGIEIDKSPSEEERHRCKLLLRQLHDIASTQTIFLFNGALDYSPNLEAVKNIVDEINPYLLSSGLLYKIIICGRGLPATLDSLKDYADKNIIYAGFVDDITTYFKGADVFINPVVEGGGIKTKIVEALGYNTKVISTRNGSIGVREAETAGQLIVVGDEDWQAFSKQMILAADVPASQIPDSFYKKFFWGNITVKAAGFIS